ncbi:putative F-box and FNIP repeat-containing protein [Acanthamoeba polyphaga mimivirus]|nr:putative F-box and FNIP repeat-containing protein [Acanthamoeba polyphaga mimivirus]
MTFGFQFNQPIENAIPNSTNHIEFGYMFNQSLKNSIPDSVTRLIFNYGLKSIYKINKKFINDIPKTVSVILFR